MSSLKEFDPADFPDEEGEEEEEEEDFGELVVVDDEKVEQTVEGIKTKKPVPLAQAVDIVLGLLGYKSNFIKDEELTLNPLVEILPTLIDTLVELYDGSAEGTAKHEKLGSLLEKVAAAMFDSFDKFKREQESFAIFCHGVYMLRNHSALSKKAFSYAAHLGMAREPYREITQELFYKMITDEAFAISTVQLQYTELVSKADATTLTAKLPAIVEFFVKNNDHVISYVKSIIQRQSSALQNAMQTSDKSIFSWNTIITLNFLTEFMLQTEDKRLLIPMITILTTFLRNFPVSNYLPFQIHVGILCQKISSSTSSFIPIFFWVTDAVQFLCQCKCKGKGKFLWENEILMPAELSIEAAETGLDRIQRLLLSCLIPQSNDIAFPEFIQPIISKLDGIVKTSPSKRLTPKVSTTVKHLKKQQEFLVNLKKEIKFTTREQQIELWNQAIEQKRTPLNALFETESKLQEKLEELEKAQQSKSTTVVDENGDTLEVATVDDV